MQNRARHRAGAAQPETACRCRRGTRRQQRGPQPTLRLSPYAWSKLLYLRDRGETEVGGFGITTPDDPLLVTDVIAVRQRCTPVGVSFDDEAVADFFDAMVDAGHRPENCGRIWMHTHPADSAAPSETDEETFARCFGGCDWAVMAILACGGQTYARLAFHVGPGGAVEIPVRVDFAVPFPAADRDDWEREYAANVVTEEVMGISETQNDDQPESSDFRDDDLDGLEGDGWGMDAFLFPDMFSEIAGPADDPLFLDDDPEGDSRAESF